MSELSGDPEATIVSQPAAPDGDGFEIGRVVGGKYKIVSLLGRGGIGSVYKVEQILLSQNFALKTLNSQRAADQMVRRFQNEARAASSLSHTNLVKVIDFGLLEGQQPYLVMDLVEGPTLSEYLRKNGSLSLDEAVSCFAQICLGLSYAHVMGIVHRDIKPSNIMISSSLPFGAEGFIKVVDFGIAKIAYAEGGEMQALTTTGEVFGSPLYMSPEQCYGAAVDRRSDIYSLGCVLFEALTGTTPFVGQNALATMMLHQSEKPPTLKEASLGKEFPPQLEQIVAKLLAKSPADRYQDLGIVANDLAQLSKGAPVLGIVEAERRKAAKQDEPLKMSRKEFQLWIAATAIGVSCASGAIGYFAAQWQNSIRSPATTADTSYQKRQEGGNLSSSEQQHQAERQDNQTLAKAVDGVIASKDYRDQFNDTYYAAREMADKARPGNVGENEKALKRLNELLAFTNKDRLLSRSFTSGLEERIAFCNAKLGRYSLAESYLHKATKSALGPDMNIGRVYEFMASDMMRSSNFEKSLQYRKAAAEVFAQAHSQDGEEPNIAKEAAFAAAENYRVCAAICHERFNDDAKAVSYCSKAKGFLEAAPNNYSKGNLFMLDGVALIGLNKPKDARTALEIGIASLKRVKPSGETADAPYCLAICYRTLAFISIKSGDPKGATRYYQEARKTLTQWKPILPAQEQNKNKLLSEITAESDQVASPSTGKQEDETTGGSKNE